MTEKEIYNGLFNAKNVGDNVLYFQRNIIDLDENIKTNVSLAKKFTELDKNNNIDSEVKSLLEDLKLNKIPSKLPEKNMFKFDV